MDYSDRLKAAEKDRPILARGIDSQLMIDAAECDYIAQEPGFSGLREAFSL